MFKTMKVRIYPTEKQKERIEYLFNCRKEVWNYFVNLNNEICKENELKSNGLVIKPNKYNGLHNILSRFDMNNMISILKNSTGLFKNIPVVLIQNTTEDVANSYNNYYKTRKYLPKIIEECSTYRITISETAGRIQIVNSKNKIYLTTINAYHKAFKTIIKDKNEGIKFKGYINKNKIKEIKLVTIKKYLNKYFISITYSVNEPETTGKKAVGIDLGINKFLTDSYGNKVYFPNVDEYDKRIDKLKSIRDKDNKDLNFKIQRLYYKRNNIINDFLHKVSNYYVINYDIICLENLKVKDMIEKNYLLKENIYFKQFGKYLNRKTLRQNWNKFLHMIVYKAKEYGKDVRLVNPMFTSQMCYNCKTIDKDNRNREIFKCRHCNYKNDADVNAAKNIEDIGYRNE